MRLPGSMNVRSNRVKIDLSALVHNFRQVKMLVDHGTKIMAVVKSDAYGHGLLPVSQTLEKEGVDALGVAHIHEALRLRKGGVKTPIVILSGIQKSDEASQVVEHDLIPILFDAVAAEILARESVRRDKKVRVQLKIDTGMGRLGIPYRDTASFIETIKRFKGLALEGLTSHLSSADEPSPGFTKVQIERFHEALEQAAAQGLHLSHNNLANSAGIMAHKATHFDMVRPGIMLYGGLPSPDFVSPVPLRPVMQFLSPIIQVRDLPDQTPISYGKTYYTNGPCRVAIVAAGYGDGLPRSASNKGNALIHEVKVPVVGRICMNLTICDITGLKGVEPGDETVFLGGQGEALITGDELARSAGTISYEIFCSIGRQNIREY